MTVAVPATGGNGEQLVNGEAVEVDVRHARIGSRGLALLLDMVVQVVLGLLIFSLSGALSAQLLGDAVDEALIEAIATTSVILAFIAYPTVAETLSNGRSLGKRAMGLRVVREDGGPIRVRHALVRSLVGAAVEWPGLLFPPFTWAVALTTMLFSPQGRRLGDLAAGTFVIHERAPAPWGWVPAMPPGLGAWAAALDLTNLDDDLALAARHYLARAAEIRQPMNGRFAHGLAAEVSEKIGQPVPPGVPSWMFLSAVLAERRRRANERVHATRALTQRIWPGFGRPAWSRAIGPTWDPAGTNPPLLGVMKEEGRPS
ncbi:transporter [Actinoplanes sp. NBRC 14428]|uniref:Putative RDD family membrane protein YckC n=1 Tax=Pseudosporangium ferrugineum TaxID=439699 RepID=A0A2T0R964_9ACTN|nr:RDD family protein [Pseudosporangium ferrugineum]PRY17679.1 putative RDD family membrane protein YckC [Pseudosporangium ferrugineum]BCJ51338.1 transporter [Actinoplanes sp. NBRC 14428]